MNTRKRDIKQTTCKKINLKKYTMENQCINSFLNLQKKSIYLIHEKAHRKKSVHLILQVCITLRLRHKSKFPYESRKKGKPINSPFIYSRQICTRIFGSFARELMNPLNFLLYKNKRKRIIFKRI